MKSRSNKYFKRKNLQITVYPFLKNIAITIGNIYRLRNEMNLFIKTKNIIHFDNAVSIIKEMNNSLSSNEAKK